jgi:carboxymethylenebutenolidase
MKTENITVELRDGAMGAYLAIPDQTPAGAIIAIMEIWGVNDTMRHHAYEFAEAGYLCLVPDLFWRQEPGVELITTLRSATWKTSGTILLGGRSAMAKSAPLAIVWAASFVT